mmetsp:Transcript_32865/g.76445  ORF Transcript_32865/g.76445 Transcript_32865/m.76445 type:complete len:294 (-) Transcript_32865:56-937(-)
MEDLQSVVDCVAPLPEVLLRAVEQQYAVAVAPNVNKGLANNAQRHCHVEDTHDHQQRDDDRTRCVRRRDVSIAHCGHGNNGEPDGSGQGVDVVTWLHHEDQGRENERDFQQGKQENRQGLKSLRYSEHHQAESFKAPQRLHEPQDRHHAHEAVTERAVRKHEAQIRAGQQWQHCQQVDEIVEICQEPALARAREEAQQPFDAKQDLESRLQHRATDASEHLCFCRLHECRNNGREREGQGDDGVPASGLAGLRVVEEVPHRHHTVCTPVPAFLQCLAAAVGAAPGPDVSASAA